MNLIFITHPEFLGSSSMPKYARWLYSGMQNRGHNVSTITADPVLFDLSDNITLKKWFGYIDQYLIFPRKLKSVVKKSYNPKNTLIVFTDHALGPWIPKLSEYCHVIHCHDFLAQRSALGEVLENPTSGSGKIYQKYIRRGFLKGNNFICISNKTQVDLQYLFQPDKPNFSRVIYNGLNQTFTDVAKDEARKKMGEYANRNLKQGYFLHVGGNQWYKNRIGVIKIYNAVRDRKFSDEPLILIGKKPDKQLLIEFENSGYRDDIIFLTDVPNQLLNSAYSGAVLFLFPSRAEGFGWPIAEAMASGTIVLTTNEAPMTEVGGNAALYCDKMPINEDDILSWSNRTAEIINLFFKESTSKHDKRISDSFINVERFNSEKRLDDIERTYKDILVNC